MKIQRIDYFSRFMKNNFIDEKSNEVSTLIDSHKHQSIQGTPAYQLSVIGQIL
jgi:hypothetical protein